MSTVVTMIVAVDTMIIVAEAVTKRAQGVPDTEIVDENERQDFYELSLKRALGISSMLVPDR